MKKNKIVLRKIFTPKLKDKVERIPYYKIIILLVLLNLFAISFILFLNNKLPPEIPLFYGHPEGEGQLARSEMLILPSCISLFVIIFNSLLCLSNINVFLKKTLVISSAAISFLTLTATFKIFFLVGSLF